jgi:hypothetical protein
VAEEKTDYILELRHITKIFPGVTALSEGTKGLGPYPLPLIRPTTVMNCKIITCYILGKII